MTFLTGKEQADLVIVAKLYYKEGLTQDKIAEKIGVSRPTISKMLAKAKDYGIVTVNVCSSIQGDVALLKLLQKKFVLAGGLVIPHDEKTEQHSQLIAEYLISEMVYERNIGLGWGYVLGEAITAITERTVRGLSGSVVPLIGKVRIPNKGYRVNELCDALARSCGREPETLMSSAFPESQEILQEYEQSEEYKHILKQWNKLDAAVIEVRTFPGVPDEATALRFGETLHQRRAVGNILSYYYDIEGKFIKGDNDFATHIPLVSLKKTKKVIAIATNSSAKAVVGALKTGMVTHIIVNEATVRNILEL